MTEHLRDRLHEEMSGYLPPPADDLVGRAVADGLRTRRVRRTASGLGTVAVVGLTVLALTVGSQIGAGPASGSSAGTVAEQAGGAAVAHAVTKVAPAVVAKPKAVAPKADTSTAASTAPARPAGTVADKVAMAEALHALQQAASAAAPPQWTPAPTGVPATPQGELQLFTEQAAAYGTPSHLAVSDDADQTHVSAYFTADGKTGALQFSLEHDTLGYAGDCLTQSASYTAEFAHVGPGQTSCQTTADGGYVVLTNDNAGCVNTADVLVVHPDGTAVHVFLASCLTKPGKEVQPGTQTLTVDDTLNIFQDPGFDFTMPADVVARGAQNLGTLATFW